MKITWLGQLGLWIETDRASVMVDPYLTDSIYERVGEGYKRLVPLRPEYLACRPDVILLTHDHSDHLDIPSLKALLHEEHPIPVLAGSNAWEKARKAVGGSHNYVQMTPGTEWSVGNLRFRAVQAFHSDPTAVGFVIHCEGLTLYITGDTLYSRELARQVGEPVDVLITVVNGQGNNMNGTDAARLAQDVGAKLSIPTHWGLFARFSDDPEEFLLACRERKLRGLRAKIYEQLDLNRLLKGEM